jgi:hypothetical protein
MKQYLVLPRALSERPASSVGAAPVVLPPKKPQRWVVKNKLAVVIAVQTGALTVEAACAHYEISTEEFASWQSLVDRHGIKGLRATRVQIYREQESIAQRDAKDRADTAMAMPADRDIAV